MRICGVCRKEIPDLFKGRLIIDPTNMRIYWLCGECHENWLLGAYLASPGRGKIK